MDVRVRVRMRVRMRAYACEPARVRFGAAGMVRVSRRWLQVVAERGPSVLQISRRSTRIDRLLDELPAQTSSEHEQLDALAERRCSDNRHSIS